MQDDHDFLPPQLSAGPTHQAGEPRGFRVIPGGQRRRLPRLQGLQARGWGVRRLGGEVCCGSDGYTRYKLILASIRRERRHCKSLDTFGCSWTIMAIMVVRFITSILDLTIGTRRHYHGPLVPSPSARLDADRPASTLLHIPLSPASRRCSRRSPCRCKNSNLSKESRALGPASTLTASFASSLSLAVASE